MSEKIDISFDNEKPSGDKIIIDLPEDKPVITSVARVIPELTSMGGKGLNLFYESMLIFPTGLESGYRLKYQVLLKDKFLNRILYNDKFIVAASFSGTLYFIESDTGVLKNEIIFEGETFEKSGLVLHNKFYINSVSSIFEIQAIDEFLDRNSAKQIYTVTQGYYIWTDLNTSSGDVFFVEYNPEEMKANLVQLNPDNGHVVFKQKFDMKKPEMSELCIFKDYVIFLCDNKTFAWSLIELKLSEIRDSPETNKFSILCSAGNRLFIYSSDNMIYYSDSLNDFKPTGIKRTLINSLGVMKKFVIFSKPDGWEIVTESGSPLYAHEDNDVNNLQAISNNIICLSKKNKLLMYNPEKFTEAEGIAIRSEDSTEVNEIIAAAINDKLILSLTKNGIVSGISNDKLNINV